MRQIINFLLWVSFLFCYLSWPPDHSMFVYEVVYEIFTNTKNVVSNFTHPIILVGFIAQVILLYAALKKDSNKKINTIGVILLCPIVLLFFIVGLLSLDYKIAGSTLPFLSATVMYFIHLKKNRTSQHKL